MFLLDALSFTVIAFRITVSGGSFRVFVDGKGSDFYSFGYADSKRTNILCSSDVLFFALVDRVEKLRCVKESSYLSKYINNMHIIFHRSLCQIKGEYKKSMHIAYVFIIRNV